MSSLLQQERMMRSKNFSQTCNLLSQYMKENKGSFGPTGMNLSSSSSPAPAPVMGVPSPLFYNREVNKSMDLFPQRTGFAPTTTSTETKKPEAAQMTIFYGGKVLVFDNLPVEKAKEVMNFAKNFSPVTSNSVAASKDVLPPRPVQQPQQQVQQKQFGDLPIARKASLHRFLEKRKDRINAKAPYQVTGTPATKSGQTQANKIDESKSWLGLASQTGQQWGLAYQL
ncbi:hypothetical protein C5167_044814 [Papaver somniferum]|uniref:protein TIFY 10b-like n=1 Tax=Papaver somniferum TaxID=3469 RepID=UPI000E6FE449|nr:protein TIFY 10b-like [Papaver somniferum]RZC90185.1 hypothetical protein C5167_044814 [Papaver somniferum]